MVLHRNQDGTDALAETPELVQRVRLADDQPRGMPLKQFALAADGFAVEAAMGAARVLALDD